MMSIQRLPPLKSIEAFVSVVNTSSFAKAAGELNITKSAITRRIQSLEADLRVQLLRRTNQGVQLTPEGDAYFKITGPAFKALRSARANLQRRCLRVALPQSLASAWLIPRLPDFYAKHPDIDLQLDSLGYFKSLELETSDVVLQITGKPRVGLHCEKLLDLVQFPVCSPALLKRSPVSSVRDLASHTLLHLSTMPQAWRNWLDFVGHPDMEASAGPQFDVMPLLMEAAANGIGFAMTSHILCEQDLERGRLVAPFAERMQNVLAVYFVCRKPEVSNRALNQFRDWLISSSAMQRCLQAAVS